MALAAVVFAAFSTTTGAQLAVDEADVPGDPALWTDAAAALAEEDEATMLDASRYDWSPWSPPVLSINPPTCGGGTLETSGTLSTATSSSADGGIVCLDGGASLDGAAVVDGGGATVADGTTFDASVTDATIADPLSSTVSDTVAVTETQDLALAEAPVGPLGEATSDVLVYEESVAEPLPAETPSAEPQPITDATVAATRSPSRGFNTGQLVGWSDADMTKALDRMAETRSSVHRLTIFWWDIQPQRDLPPSQWNWGPYDRVIRAARSRGLRLVLDPMGSPNWARPGREYPDIPGDDFKKFGYPDDIDAWGRFIRELARRYNPEGFEIWNEQNSRRFWDPAPPGTPVRPGPNPVKYTALFCRAAREIRALRPGETVGMGGLAPHRVTSSSGGSILRYKASDYLRAAYAAGAARCNMTFVGYHPYVINSYCAPSNPNLSATPGMLELAAVRRVMRARGQGSRRIWNTEWGFPSQRFVTRRDAAGNPTRYCVYTETRQRNLIRREHLYLRRLGYMRFSIYFNIKDSWPPTEKPENNPFFTIGMLRRDADWSRKPSFFTWRALP